MNPIQTVLASLHSMVIEALEKSKSMGLIKFDQIPEFLIEVPREKEHGDFACNVALLMARQARQAPRVIAEVLVELMETSGRPVEKVEIAGAGFINFSDRSWLYEIPLMVYKSR